MLLSLMESQHSQYHELTDSLTLCLSEPLPEIVTGPHNFTVWTFKKTGLSKDIEREDREVQGSNRLEDSPCRKPLEVVPTS